MSHGHRKGTDEARVHGAAAPRLTAGGKEPGASGAPPSSKTGVKTDVVVACVHWATLTVWRDDHQVIREVATRGMGVKEEAFEYLPYGGHGYRRCALLPLGVRVYFDPVDGEGHCSVSIPGGALEATGFEWVGTLTRYWRMRGVRVRATRIDLALDGGEYTPADVRDAWLGGDVRSYTRRENWGWRNSGEGVTFEMGSRTSERYGRCYDRRGPTRFEVELKGERAAAVWDDLMAYGPDEWADAIRGHVRDFVEFSTDWWDALMGGAIRAALKLSGAARATLESVHRWVVDQVAPSLAALTEARGGDLGWLVPVLASGATRYRAKHRLLLQEVMA